MIKSEGKPLEVDFFSICDAIHEKVCLCAPRGPTHGPAFACRDSCRVGDFCIRSFVLNCFPPPPSSMLQHPGYTRMPPEIAHAAIALAWLASKAAASRSEFGACAPVQVLSSSPSHAVGDIEERKQKDQDARRCESSGRECHAPGPV